MPAPSLTTIPRRNLAHEVVQWLRNEIISGGLRPGEALAEPVLAKQLGISRAPVREALIEMEREGLVQFETTGRTRVRTLTEKDFDEIVEARIALESMGAQRATALWTKENSAVVEKNIEAQSKASTLAELSRLDVEMHEYIMRCSNNSRLLTLWLCIRWQFEMCLAHTHRLQEKLAFEPRRITVDSHRQLLAALASGKPKIAAQTMATHIEGSLEWSLVKVVAEEPNKEPRIMKSKRRGSGSVVALLVTLCAAVANLQAAEMTAPDAAFFEKQVRPVLETHCAACHSHEKKIRGGLVLDSRSGWEQGGNSGPAVVPGKPEASLLIQAIRHADKDLAMPPNKKLSDSEITILTEWVARGAPDPRISLHKNGADLAEGKKHWALQPLTNPATPIVEMPQDGMPLDAFIRAKLRERHLVPARLADRTTLIRRATYDLTGLPPTETETAAFAKDPLPEKEAFVRVLDRLLASPAYGEKWGRHWLDVAHYADTTGCSSDWPIDDMWRYRDWVVKAFNQDIPFDRFLKDQLAGDLLAADMVKDGGKKAADSEVYRERIIATGFLATAKRFGSDPGGYDVLTIGDTLDTTWRALQGLSVGCARCHDHKFDPIKASDYYALYGIFASSLYPYTSAEKNQNAALLVPLEDVTKLDAWNRQLPGAGNDPKPRSVLASSSNRWGFEDNETSEDVADHKPLSPWVSEGGVMVKDGGSPYAHLLPKGIKEVQFQATAKTAQMYRRVRWDNTLSDLRTVAFDLQLTTLWKEAGGTFRLTWKSEQNGSKEISLATINKRQISLQGLPKTAAIFEGPWYHLRLTYSLASSKLTLVGWNVHGDEVMRVEAPNKELQTMRSNGDLALSFETEAINNQRKACVRLDNIVAEVTSLEPPVKARSEAVAATAATPEAKKAAEEQRAAVYEKVLPQKPETAFAMWEGTPHDVALQKRGEPEQPGAIVPRRNLLLFGGTPLAHPQEESGRRELADWMLADSNPLTLRVFVNRLWQWHFGRGIVASSNDFGHKGERPTHPELLDFLVQRFRAQGLSIKAMHREMMLSHTYRESSNCEAATMQSDPDNLWLARFSPRRLTAEEVRDSVLVVSGLLDEQGPGYKQPFPPLNRRGWTQHYPFGLSYEASFDHYDHRKRSLYLPVVRFVADPFLSTFDGADSNQSVGTRGETSVALQGLAMMNARFVVDAANELAKQAMQQTEDALAIEALHRQVFGTTATSAMTRRLVQHLDIITHEQGLSRQEALAVVAQSLLGSNAFLYVF